MSLTLRISAKALKRQKDQLLLDKQEVISSDILILLFTCS